MSADNAIAVAKLGENDYRVREIGCSQTWTRKDFLNKQKYASMGEAMAEAYRLEEEVEMYGYVEYGVWEADLTVGDYEPFA